MEREESLGFGFGSGLLSLWAGLLIGPLVALLQLEANYALAFWACGHDHMWLLHVVSLLALSLSLSAGVVAYLNWRRLGAQLPKDEAGVAPRSRFMSFVGILVSALMTMVIIAQWIPLLMIGPCER